MKIDVVEKTKDKIVLEVHGEDHTFLNILRENAWKTKAKQAGYIIEHPYLSEPKFIIRGRNPKKMLIDAAQLTIDQTEEFEKEFKRAIKTFR